MTGQNKINTRQIIRIIQNLRGKKLKTKSTKRKFSEKTKTEKGYDLV